MHTDDLAQSQPVPFGLALRHSGRDGAGRFTPEARVTIGTTLAASGLLRELEPETAVLLLLVLATVTPNGDFVATPHGVSEALGVSPAAALERLRQAGSVLWCGVPLLTESAADLGLILFRPNPALFAVTVEPPPETEVPLPPVGGPGIRERVIAFNRQEYTRPRSVVEAEIEAFYVGEPVPVTEEDRERFELKRRLVWLGLTRDQAAALMGQFPRERVERQLAWLPYRNARNPAGYVVAAIEGDYEPPAAWLARAESVPAPHKDEEPGGADSWPANAGSLDTALPAAAEPGDGAGSPVTLAMPPPFSTAPDGEADTDE